MLAFRARISYVFRRLPENARRHSLVLATVLLYLPPFHPTHYEIDRAASASHRNSARAAASSSYKMPYLRRSKINGSVLPHISACGVMRQVEWMS